VTTPDVPSLLELAVEVAHEAGELITRRRPVDLGVSATKTSPTDVVTVMDTAAESLIRDRIGELRPGDGFLGEEGGASATQRQVVWVIDPIDGTVNYLYDIPHFAVSIGIRIAGTVVAGVVHDPNRQEDFTAVLGGGARLNGREIRVSGQTDPAQSMLLTGFSYQVATRAAQARSVAAVLPRVRDIRRFGSAALDLCWVACARAEAFCERGLRPWDLAAGGLVAREAGARVSGLRGKPAGEHLVIAANPALYDILHDLLVDAGFDD
jgi:myo-inositol-1(or 4)-monophosphatase